jgi:hypothetical protein
MSSIARPAAVALLLLLAACGSISKGGDPQQGSWNTLWPTAPDPAYWGAWKSDANGSWLGINSSGEGYLYRDEGKESGWVRTPLRVVKPRWGSGWDLVTEAGARYRMQGETENAILVSGPGVDGRFERAALPDEVAAAAPRQQVEGAPKPAFSTDEDNAWWWPF